MEECAGIEIYYVPADLTYTIETSGTDTGTLDLYYMIPREGNYVSEVVYEGIPTNVGSKTFTNMGQEVTDYTMKLDNDGDGTIDQTKDPDYYFENVEDVSPTTTLTNYPDSIIKGNLPKVDVTFSWTGSDNVTPPENLVYQYKLEGCTDYENWSDWTSETTKTFTLPSGNYTFKVRAKDETGNYPDEDDPATAKYSFTVSLPIIVYPNPCYPNKGQVVTIANLPLKSKVYIYTISGELVRVLDDATEITRNEAGNLVAQGVYIYFVPQATDKKTGKIAIIK